MVDTVTVELPDPVTEVGLKVAVASAGKPLTLNATKQAVARLQGRLTSEEGEDLIRMCYMSSDFREGLDAFLNKRTPQWRGQ